MNMHKAISSQLAISYWSNIYNDDNDDDDSVVFSVNK